MTRKEFLFVIWKKAIRPILFIGVIYFTIDFLYKLYIDEGEVVSTLIIGVFLLLLLYSAVHLLNIVLDYFSVQLKSILPEKVKVWFKFISKLFRFLPPILLGIAIYHLWNKDRLAVCFMGAYFIYELYRLTKNGREKKDVLDIAN
ncbi:hypothetical protein [Winogradskyella sp. MH6]|uniref:hypothetical protein n=1 Tax=Winogradskyella sp. MH6 TaxID=2929510 RepID=UPI001FB4441B|nr:hypothetical protein [Winogradskyella sp. MH6]